ncbi:MAG: PIN/TRAM domain-containing protein [Kiritimatiellia bacterium]
MNAARLLMAVLGGLLGFKGATYFSEIGFLPAPSAAMWVLIATIVVGSFIGALLTRPVVVGLSEAISGVIGVLHRTPTYDIAVGSLGLISGLIIGVLATLPLPRDIPVVGTVLPAAVTLIMGYIGAVVAVRKRDDLTHMVSTIGTKGSERSGRSGGRTGKQGVPKIVDTSVIIDGRIADVVETGFLEGPLVVPSFVLAELQHIADSADVLKRNRGRRGLDILNRIQKDAKVLVQILDRDVPDVADVDGKLVRLAKQLEGRVVTNDFNLNKVAELQGVSVLNINELVNAVKPVVLPGEEMIVRIVKDGKEQGQGVGYLDDGTMIVVDGGRRYIGDTVDVQVTNVLQTAAGRMIFAKPKVMERAL